MKTPGSILADLILAQSKGEDTSQLKDDFERETCNFFAAGGANVSCGAYKANAGGMARLKDMIGE